MTSVNGSQNDHSAGSSTGIGLPAASSKTELNCCQMIAPAKKPRNTSGADELADRRRLARLLLVVGQLRQEVDRPVRDLVALAVALDQGEDRGRPEREVHGDREGDAERRAERLSDAACDEVDDEQRDERDRQHDHEEELEQSHPVVVVLRTDQPRGPIGVLAGQPRRVAELLQGVDLGVLGRLAGLEAGLDRVLDRGAQFAPDLVTLVFGQRPDDRPDVAFGQLGRELACSW